MMALSQMLGLICLALCHVVGIVTAANAVIPRRAGELYAATHPLSHTETFSGQTIGAESDSVRDIFESCWNGNKYFNSDIFR